MALGKRIKVGGAYYKGYALAVASASGEYTQVIEETGGMAVNSISVTPNTFGDGDTWKLIHHAGVSGTGDIISVLAQDVNNMGKGAAVMLDFPAAERVDAGESLMFTYLNTASIAGTTYLLVESVGLQKTAE
jgi:hypothetical protein